MKKRWNEHSTCMIHTCTHFETLVFFFRSLPQVPDRLFVIARPASPILRVHQSHTRAMAGDTTSAGASEYVKLISADNFTFVIDKRCAMGSGTIRNMLSVPGSFCRFISNYCPGNAFTNNLLPTQVSFVLSRLKERFWTRLLTLLVRVSRSIH